MYDARPRRFPLAAAMLTLVAPLAFSSCAALYFLGGKGEKPALCTIPKGKRVLVFVDAPAAMTLPPDYAKALGQKINDHLYKYKAADSLVAQDRLNNLRNDPTFARIGIADVARETQADIVIYVNITAIAISTSTDKSVSQGNVQASVKAVDSTGKRLFPLIDPAGSAVQADLEPALLEGRPESAIINQLNDLLAIRVGRMFHKYSLDDADMNK